MIYIIEKTDLFNSFLEYDLVGIFHMQTKKGTCLFTCWRWCII